MSGWVGRSSSAQVLVMGVLLAQSGGTASIASDFGVRAPAIDLHNLVKPYPVPLRAGPVKKGKRGKIRRW